MGKVSKARWSKFGREDKENDNIDISHHLFSL